MTMTNYVIQENILPGQYTYLRNEIFMAEPRVKHSDCVLTCQAKTFPKVCEHPTPCTGFCHRWRNGNEILFRKVDETVEKPPYLVETHFMASARRFNEENVLRLIHRNKEGEEVEKQEEVEA